MFSRIKISLNPTQKEAVEHPIDAPLKVIAGAGTGKTMVLTHRFVYILLEHPDIAPQNILALTFTNKAAAEMKERIISLAREEGIISSDGASPPRLWIGTFHSFCGRILRENAFEAGLEPGFVVLNEADARQIYHRIVDDFLSLRLNTGDFKPEECEYVSFERTQFLYSHIYRFISKLKGQLVTPEEFRDKAVAGHGDFYSRLGVFFDNVIESPDLASSTRKALEKRRSENVPFEKGYENEMIQIIYHIYRNYQEYLNRNDMMDFGDLILKAYFLLSENEAIRNRYQERFRYILVDEFQDTNDAQFRMLHLIARNRELSNVTVVGDNKQAIYGWRDAKVENVDRFDAVVWGGKHLNVYQNYRSYGEILSVAHFSIIQDDRFKTESEKIKLEPERLGMAEKPVVVLYEANSREQEAGFIAYEIGKHLRMGAEAENIAILLRGLRSVKVYEDALRRYHIPYRTTGGSGFYERQEIRDLLAYLRIIDDPYDVQALTRVLKRPPVGLNDPSLCKLLKGGGEGLYEALEGLEKVLDPDAAFRVKRLMILLRKIWSISSEESIFFLISELVKKSGYLKWVYSMTVNNRERSLDNIRKLLRMASDFERKNIFSGLKDFVQYVKFSMDQMVVESEANSKSMAKSVQIMTVHQAKGLEFDTVFIANARKPSFPTQARHPMFDFHEEDGLIINLDNNGDKFYKFRPYDLKKNSHLYGEYGIVDHYRKFKEEHLREERRIWYVAITRARHNLYISCPKSRMAGGKKPDDFFQEIYHQFDGENIIRLTSEDINDEMEETELPLWKDREKSAFKDIKEAVEYGDKLFGILRNLRKIQE
ncbi:AAA family ATPase [Candidatus Poribacteria bacterium]|nr:AAA family ATPase [Candidatus Poribacteria bacterium]